MPRHMNFALTTEQVKDHSQDVIRTPDWAFLKAGETLWAVNEPKELKKGELADKLALIEVVSVTTEPLSAITKEDCAREGFPEMSPKEYIAMFCEHHGGHASDPVQRVEFKYLNWPPVEKGDQ